MKKIKILKLDGSFGASTSKISYANTPLGDLTIYRYRQAYGIPADKQWFWNWNVLDSHYKQGDPQLLAVYAEIAELAKKHDILYHMVGDMMHPDFIRTLSKRFGGPIYTIYNVDGEPASSAILSHPVVNAFDFALTCSKMYDDLRSCPIMLFANGAYGSGWVACGTKYVKNHWAWDIPIDENKDIDVVFLGANMKYQLSSEPYPPNKYKAVEFLIDKGLNVHCEEWTGIEMAAKLYARSKVGINLHGPSPFGVGNAQRLYDLAVCGVGIVSDGAGLGLDEIFTAEEISSYLWSNFEEMYYHVQYLLDNPEIRIGKAIKARERVRNCYRNDFDDNWMLRGTKLAIEYWKQKGLWKESQK